MPDTNLMMAFVLWFLLGSLAGWSLYRAMIARRVRPLLATLDRPEASRKTREAGEQIARVLGA